MLKFILTFLIADCIGLRVAIPRKTSFFLYLLINARSQPVPKEELFEKIWEAHNLSPSAQRLWQVLHNLNNKLGLLGLPRDFILNIRGQGYVINYPDVIPVYYKVSELPTHAVKKREKIDNLSE